MSAYGMDFADAQLFRTMMKSGSFALLLDGLNEVKHDEEVQLFARTNPSIRVLVTSQTTGYTGFVTLSLPTSISEAIEPLLDLYLGSDRGKAIYQTIAATPLLEAVQSGYDIRLIADLVEDQDEICNLPLDRLGLYEAILHAVRLDDGSQYPRHELCHAAWLMWRDGNRKLQPNSHNIDEDRIKPLLVEVPFVLRLTGNNLYEFRHDQMRAYLAAQWAAKHEVNPQRLFEEDTGIWRLAAKEQEEVWEFFAMMVGRERGEGLWAWATEDPDRVVLQHALQRVGLKKGWDLKVIAVAIFVKT